MIKKIGLIVLYSVLALTIVFTNIPFKKDNNAYRLAGDIVGPQSIEPINPINIGINILG